MDDVRNAMRLASKHRSTGDHKMNEHSSRSHLVLTVNAETKNKVSGQQTNGKLSLIDLAGSERVSKTDATGERLKEAQNINRSLSALGDVISALQERKKHIPFRNSKLTYLLQNSLAGESKVAMFVNISPVQSNAQESTCSLNFASRCQKVALGQARKNIDSNEIVKYRKVIDDLQAQIASIQRVNGFKASTPKKPRRGSKTSQ
uniref:Kinesin motor domain-containing protein n=2 Tax=Aplanochytrium stocchinoi TaxID=215587 RepID=A0A7S3PEJ0_9STRA|mmetsp:Transcript_19226/g.23392  ORF Transcript_19226/g.23392 Transcript_19226/m.23392 type:complete len:204 (-) Transcript_19226:4-615(-)